jgi:hypothetical protein
VINMTTHPVPDVHPPAKPGPLKILKAAGSRAADALRSVANVIRPSRGTWKVPSAQAEPASRYTAKQGLFDYSSGASARIDAYFSFLATIDNSAEHMRR